MPLEETLFEKDARVIGSKAVLLSVYFGLLFACCSLPFVLLHQRLAFIGEMRWIGYAILAGVAAVETALVAARGFPGMGSPLVLSLVFLAPLVTRDWGQSWRLALGGLTAVPLLATMTWWAPEMELGPARAMLFLLLGTAAAALPRLMPQPHGMPAMPALSALMVCGLASVLLTGVYATPMGLFVLWHHWSVYVGAAEAFLSGAIPFWDFPVQYGMGPMLAVSALCRDECWTGAYVAVAATGLLYVLAMAGGVLALTARSSRGTAVLALVAMGCATLLWTGYPPDFLGALSTPSVHGMRFLPLAGLLFVILRAEARGVRPDLAGHALWMLGLAWSPEAAFFATAVWWPYLALRHAQAKGAVGFPAIVLAVLQQAGVASLALAVGIGVLVLLFRAAFGDWPSLDGFTAYLRNPPGILPINPTGAVWFGLAAVGIGSFALCHADAPRRRMVFACLMGLLAVGSYYLGRSHDNNILNLLPFVVLVLTAAMTAGLPAVPMGFARVAMAGLTAYTATFGIQMWAMAWRTGEAGNVGSARLIELTRFATPDSWALLQPMLEPQSSATDAGIALRWLRERNAPSPLWLSSVMLLPRNGTGEAWSGLNNLAVFAPLPPEEVETFIRQGAQHLHRPGWVLLDTTQPSLRSWLDLFARAYDVAEEHSFGSYVAYRLEPR